jgi:4-aminobutyrate aminotransferase-like enzyme
MTEPVDRESLWKIDDSMSMGLPGRDDVVVVRGKGTHIWDASGRRYTNLFSGISVVNVGHSHPMITKTVAAQARRYMQRLVQNSARRGEQMMRLLRESAERHNQMGEIRGKGLIIGVELAKDTEKTPAQKEASAVKMEMQKRGYLNGVGGIYRNVLRIQPPLIITAEEVDSATKALDQSIAAVFT